MKIGTAKTSSQNRSSAVMQHRSEPHDSLDDFPTPPWATRALLERLPQLDPIVADGWGQMVVREPAANRGHMARPLSEYFGEVLASDVHDYGAGYPVVDYLFAPLPEVDWTITNPPFRLGLEFIQKALAESRRGVAMFTRGAFLESSARYYTLFSQVPPTFVLIFVERVVIHRGCLAPDGSSATNYCWLVWSKTSRNSPPRIDWIAPCRTRLEQASDYPPAPEQEALLPGPLLELMEGAYK